MTIPNPRRTKLTGASTAAAASLASFAVSALLSTSADAAQDPDAPPPPPPVTTTTPPPATTTTPPPTVTPPPETTTITVVEPTTPPPAPPPSTTTVAVPEPGTMPARWEEPEKEETQFDDSFDIYVAPGVINVPFGGEDGVDYFDRFNPGYQWGLGLGWFERSERSDFAMGVGGFFDHAIINSASRDLEDLGDVSENVFRAGLELRPGFVIGERLFLNIPIRGGYAGRVTATERGNDIDTDIDQGGYVGVAGGFDLAVVRGLYLGTVAGADFQFFRIGRDHDLYTVTWRAHIGYRF